MEPKDVAMMFSFEFPDNEKFFCENFLFRLKEFAPHAQTFEQIDFCMERKTFVLELFSIALSAQNFVAFDEEVL